jgi:hypothetical protein
MIGPEYPNESGFETCDLVDAAILRPVAHLEDPM